MPVCMQKAILERIKHSNLDIWDMELFWVLVHYDYMNAPSNWDPKYKHEKVIKSWMDWMKENDKSVHYISEINKSVDRCQTSEELEEQIRCGYISEILFDSMMCYFT